MANPLLVGYLHEYPIIPAEHKGQFFVMLILRGGTYRMETKTAEAFTKFVESFSPPRNRRRVITAFYVSLADQHESEMLEYATTHEAELVGIFEGDHIQRIARTAEAMAA